MPCHVMTTYPVFRLLLNWLKPELGGGILRPLFEFGGELHWMNYQYGAAVIQRNPKGSKG